MTIKELKEKIKTLPDDTRVDFGIDVKINAQTTLLTRSVDHVEHLEKNNVIILKSGWGIQFFY